MPVLLASRAAHLYRQAVSHLEQILDYLSVLYHPSPQLGRLEAGRGLPAARSASLFAAFLAAALFGSFLRLLISRCRHYVTSISHAVQKPAEILGFALTET